MTIIKKILLFLFMVLITQNNTYSDYVMPISADLDFYDIRIGYGFSGDYLTLFGSKENLEKIAVTVSGPERDFMLNKRQKWNGFWIKRDIKKLNNHSSYFATWVSHDLKKRKDLLDFYGFKTFLDKNNDDIQNDFEQYMIKQNLYYPIDLIQAANNDLFKILIPLPNNATVGTYLLNVISLGIDGLNGKISMSFNIIHSEFNKFIYDINKNYHKTYVALMFLISIANILLVRYFIFSN